MDRRWFDPEGGRLFDRERAPLVEQKPSFVGTAFPMTAAAFSPDGRYLAVGSRADDRFRLYDLSTKSPPGRHLLWATGGAAVAFSADGKWLFSGSSDGALRAWKFALLESKLAFTRSAPLILRGHDGAVASLAASRDGRWLVSGAADGSIHLWSLETIDAQREPSRFHVPSPSVLRAPWDFEFAGLSVGDPLWGFVCGEDRLVSLAPSWMPEDPQPAAWDLHTLRVAALNRLLPDDSSATALSAEAGTVATIGNDAMRFFDLCTGASASTIPFDDMWSVSTLLLSQNGRWVAATLANGIRLVDRNDARRPMHLKADSPYENFFGVFAKFSPGGKWLALSKGFGKIELRSLGDLTAAPRLLEWGRIGKKLTDFAFSRDDRYVGLAGDGGQVLVWDLSDEPADSVPRLFSLSSPPRAGPILVSFSTDAHWLVMGGRDDAVGLFQLRNEEGQAKSPTLLRGHGPGITALAFSPDDRRLITVSAEVQVRLWDMTEDGPSPDPVHLRYEGEKIIELQTSPDGRWLGALDWEDTIYVWSLATELLVGRARRFAGRNLTRPEWNMNFAGNTYEETFDGLKP